MPTAQNGTLDHPLSIANMLLVNSLILPGHNVYLRGGTYNGNFTFAFAGSAGNVITVRPYQTEKPKINGDVIFNGSQYIFRDMEIYWDGWSSRVSQQNGSAPTDLSLKSFLGAGATTKFINCIIHDLSSPFFGQGMTNDSEIYGCVIFHNGWWGPDRGHGHGMYVQNTTGIKYIKDCIIFDNFGWGIHAYTESGHVDNIWAEGNTCFKPGSLYGATYEPILIGALGIIADQPTLKANMTFGGIPNLGYYSGGGFTNAVIEDNYFPGGLNKMGTTQTITSESGNYYGAAIGNQVFVRPNTYQSDRANITIYNQASSDSVNVDLTSVTGLGVGDGYTLINVQDYFVDIVTGTIPADHIISVDMRAASHTVRAPYKWTAPAKTFPLFGCFVIYKS